MKTSRDKKPAKPSLAEDLLLSTAAGATAGIFSDLMLLVPGAIKVREQTQSAAGSSVEQPKGLVRTFNHVVRTYGMRELLRGGGPIAIFALPGNGAYLCGLELGKQVYGDTKLGNTIGGGLAQVFGTYLGGWALCENIRDAQQSHMTPAHLRNLSTKDLAKYLYNKTDKNGNKLRLFGTHRGAVSQMLSYGVYNAGGNGLSKTIKDYVPKEYRDNPAVAFPVFAAGFGTVAAITTPIDVISTNYKMKNVDPVKFNFDSTWGCVKHLYARGGAKEFWKGCSARTTWLALRSMVFFGTVGPVRGYIAEAAQDVKKKFRPA